MRRREFITLIGAVPATLPVLARGQSAGRVYKVGFLWDGPNVFPDALDAFHEEMRELGYIDGRNVAFEYRWTEGAPEQIRQRAEDLVRLNVDVIVAPSSIFTAAAK